jgi:hypothetical protein
MKIQAYMCFICVESIFLSQGVPRVLEFFVMSQSKRPFEKKEGLVLYNWRNGIWFVHMAIEYGMVDSEAFNMCPQKESP